MPTRNINLTDRYDSYLADQVSSGRFKNVSEAVRAALHLMEAQDRAEEAKLEALRRDVGRGFDAFQAGDVITLTGDDALDTLFDSLGEDGASPQT